MDPDKLKDVRVLLVDDDEDDQLIIRKIFEQINNSPFIVQAVSSYSEAAKLIDRDEHDIYLVDYRLGSHTGLELLERARPEKRRQPFILLTGVGNERVEWQSLELAASDYLVKGSFDANLLSRTLFYALQRKYLEEQRINQLLELNRSKDEFISIASHQLRTPATGVKQYIGMILEDFVGDITPQQRDVLQKAYDSNERQLKIVSDLLKVAQVDAGKVMLRKRKAPIGSLISEATKEFTSTLKARGQSLHYAAPKPDINVWIDEASVRMVIENILDNASKYSPEDTTITVTIEEHKRWVDITISDEGVGIDATQADRLFQKFSRLDNALSTKVGGTGLGLYWAQKIIDLHNGSIRFESVEPQGTAFTITLPKKAISVT